MESPFIVLVHRLQIQSDDVVHRDQDLRAIGNAVKNWIIQPMDGWCYISIRCLTDKGFWDSRGVHFLFTMSYDDL